MDERGNALKRIAETATSVRLEVRGPAASVSQLQVNLGRATISLYLNPKDYGCPQNRPRLYWLGAQSCEFPGGDASTFLADATACLDLMRGSVSVPAVEDFLLAYDSAPVKSLLAEMQGSAKKSKRSKDDPGWKSMHQEVYAEYNYQWHEVPELYDDSNFLFFLTERERCVVRFVKLKYADLLATGITLIADVPAP